MYKNTKWAQQIIGLQDDEVNSKLRDSCWTQPDLI